MDSKFVLTIAIPTYNRVGKLVRLLKVITQVKPHIQILVCDNASTDGTDQNVKGFEADNFKYIRNDRNLGYDKNVMQCVKYSDGEFIWFLSDDDLVSLTDITKVVSSLNDEVSGALVNATVYDSKDENRVIIDALYQGNRNGSITVNDNVLVELATWSTLISAQIIRRSEIGQLNLGKYEGSCFIQIPMFWFSVQGKKINILKNIHIKKYDATEHSFGVNSSKIWLYNWCEVISSLEIYNQAVRIKAIKSLYGPSILSGNGLIAHVYFSVLNRDRSRYELYTLLKTLDLKFIEKILVVGIMLFVNEKSNKFIRKIYNKLVER